MIDTAIFFFFDGKNFLDKIKDKASLNFWIEFQRIK